MKTTRFTEKRIEELGKEISELSITLAGMSVEVTTFKELLGRVQ
jgi:hypothetical protein